MGDGMKAELTKTPSLTRALLVCGAVAGPLFILTVLVQDYTRPAFDPRLQQLSLLSLGNWGWVQIANFVLAGVLNLLYAVGLRRRLHPGPAGTWGPLLIGAYGLGLISGGVFQDDPADGFPPGVVAPAHISWHAWLHDLSGILIFVALTAALAVFARRFWAAREHWWAFYSSTTAVLIVVLFGLNGINSAVVMAGSLRLATLLGWMAASLIGVKLLEDSGRPLTLGGTVRSTT